MKWQGLIAAVLFSASSISVGQDSQTLVAGSDERRAFCDLFADTYVSAHVEISQGKTAEQLQKEIAIAYAGDESSQDLLMLFHFGIDMADFYVKEEKTSETLKTDLLYECVTTSDVMTGVLENWFNSVIPIKHELRHRYFNTSAMEANAAEIETNEDGSLTPASYHALLGDEFTGMQSLSAYDRRDSGTIQGCGLEFAQIIYDYIYFLGQPVKVSGSININQHPVSGLSGLLKIKVEKVTIYMNSDAPPVRLEHVPLESLYSTYAGKPLIKDYEDFECEDPTYTCHVVFEWAQFAKAIIEDELGIAYKRAGGGTDVNVSLALQSSEQFSEETFKYAACSTELLQAAMDKLGAQD